MTYVVVAIVAATIGALVAVVGLHGRRPAPGARSAAETSTPARAVHAVGSSTPAHGIVRERDAPRLLGGSPTTLDPRLVEVLDRVGMGVVLCDAHGRVVHRNAGSRRLEGTHAGLLIDEAIERHVTRALSGHTTDEPLELYGPPKMVVVLRAAPITNGAIVTLEDISERRRIDAVRTDFVANISHELKTPVGALAVLAEALYDEDDRDVVMRISERMQEEAQRAARTIDDLLELSQIELEGDEVGELIAAADVVRGALQRVGELADRRGITISVLDPDEPIALHADRRQLVSALGNLVENAVKYSEPGDQVQVRTRIEQGWVEFMVADEGVGIPARDLERIFERFYRVDKARSRGTGGTGLGLSIVRHVATNHRGKVLVSSLEGEGSTFVLCVPRDERVAERGGAPIEVRPIQDVTTSHHDGGVR